MNPTLADHLLVLSVLLLLPLRGLLARPQPLINPSGKRRASYRQTTLMHTGLIVAVITVSICGAHHWAVLGITVPVLDTFMVGCAAAMSALALHLLQGAVAVRRAGRLPHPTAHLRRIQPLLPLDARERRGFYLMSVVAALSEEMLFRAYFLAYLLVLLPWQAAAALAVIAFALGHLHQGLRGVLQMTLIGSALMGMYLLTQSIWPGVLFHAGLDIISGEIGGRLLIARERWQRQSPGATRQL